MRGSLRDQLLKAGLGASEETGRPAGRTRSAARAEPDSAARIAREERELHAQRDRELRRSRQEARERKGLLAEARRLLENAAEPHGVGDIRYHFVERGKVKRVYVDRSQQEALAAGRLAVAGLDGRHYLVPPELAERARALLPEVRVAWADPRGGGPDGPGAAVPDETEP